MITTNTYNHDQENEIVQRPERATLKIKQSFILVVNSSNRLFIFLKYQPFI